MCGIAGILAAPERRRRPSRRCWRRWRAPSRIAARTAPAIPWSAASPWCTRGSPSSTWPAATSRCTPARRRWWRNGEIYNYRELRRDLPGVAFATDSDNELPLHLWLRDGRLRPPAARHVRHRDPRPRRRHGDAGARPVRHQAAVYRPDRGGPCLRLGAAGAAGGRPRAARRCARRRATNCCRCSSPPAPTPSSTASAACCPARRWSAPTGGCWSAAASRPCPRARRRRSTRTAALDRLDRALEESVDLHQRSDVPYGMFLSGGIDSAALLTMMARLNSQPVLAYTAGFDVPEAADERAAAARVAQARSAPGTRRSRSPRPIPGGICPRSSPCMDDPAADYAIIPTWFLARRARAGGEGGAVRRGRRRDFRRLWPLSQRHAAVVARRAGDAGARHARPAGRAARAPAGLARRHRGGRGAGRDGRADAAGASRRRPTWPTGCRTICC